MRYDNGFVQYQSCAFGCYVGIDGYILSCSVCRDFNPVGELGVFAICRLFFIEREFGLGQGIQYLYFGYTGEKIVFTDSLFEYYFDFGEQMPELYGHGGGVTASWDSGKFGVSQVGGGITIGLAALVCGYGMGERPCRIGVAEPCGVGMEGINVYVVAG